MARIIEVYHDQAGDLDLFQNQAERWKASLDLTEAQRAGIAAPEEPGGPDCVTGRASIR